MDLEIIILSEVNQTEENKYICCYWYVESKRKEKEIKDTNEPIYKTEIDAQT